MRAAFASPAHRGRIEVAALPQNGGRDLTLGDVTAACSQRTGMLEPASVGDFDLHRCVGSILTLTFERSWLAGRPSGVLLDQGGD